MSESPPHVPAPFPYVWPAPAAFQPAKPTYSFALSSSKRLRSASPSDDGASAVSSDDDQDLDDDPYDLAPRQDTEPRASEGSKELQETNKGMQMLLKLGWSVGKGLGKDLQGRVAPIDPSNNTGMMGLGKAALDTRMLDNTTLATRQLESQKIAKETPDQRKARMERVLYKQEVEAEIAASLDKFRCDICSKQYANVGQYDEHLRGYQHHHQARAVALKNAAREKSNASGESERRREKERKREAKELAKLMSSAGVAPPPATAAIGIVPKKAEIPAKEVEKEKEKKGGGWAKFGAFAPVGEAKPVTTTPALPPTASTSGSAGSGGGFKKGGWASAMPAASPVAAAASSETAPSSAPPSFKSAGMMSLSKEVDSQSYLPRDQLLPPAPAPPSTSRDWEREPPSQPSSTRRSSRSPLPPLPSDNRHSSSPDVGSLSASPPPRPSSESRRFDPYSRPRVSPSDYSRPVSRPPPTHGDSDRTKPPQPYYHPDSFRQGAGLGNRPPPPARYSDDQRPPLPSSRDERDQRNYQRWDGRGSGNLDQRRAGPRYY